MITNQNLNNPTPSHILEPLREWRRVPEVGVSLGNRREGHFGYGCTSVELGIARNQTHHQSLCNLLLDSISSPLSFSPIKEAIMSASQHRSLASLIPDEQKNDVLPLTAPMRPCRDRRWHWAGCVWQGMNPIFPPPQPEVQLPPPPTPGAQLAIFVIIHFEQHNKCLDSCGQSNPTSELHPRTCYRPTRF